MAMQSSEWSALSGFPLYFLGKKFPRVAKIRLKVLFLSCAVFVCWPVVGCLDDTVVRVISCSFLPDVPFVGYPDNTVVKGCLGDTQKDLSKHKLKLLG